MATIARDTWLLFAGEATPAHTSLPTAYSFVEVTAVPERVQIVVPGDNPQQIQGSPRLDRLEPYGDTTVYTDRPSSAEEQVTRAKDATILLNSRGAVHWPGDSCDSFQSSSSSPSSASAPTQSTW